MGVACERLTGDDWDGWFVETVNDDVGFRLALRAEGPMQRAGSAQALCVFRHRLFGRVLALDGAIQLTERDEFVYHEMMAHVPMMAHGAAADVLVIGGGDGGLAREVLRHRVARLTLVEIDREVIDLALSELPQVPAGAFDDPRFALVIGDGARHVAATGERYDVVVVDAPDPVGAGAALFTEEFYHGLRRVLRPEGVLVTQSGVPFLTPDWFTGHARTLRRAFPNATFFLTTVPSYTGGPMAHGFAAGRAATAISEEELARRQAASGIATRCWSPAVHRAAFALPPYIADLCSG
ncbi:polyamine aminopropyltransferase [Acuticoccus sp.]|uniref:polyamine aminopropyltransferase n=1 Tax=Acuticoccus sp. TaxID=1904378 RepID=UPI003B527243